MDVIARNCFGLKNFKISDSNVFLSASLSLSAGVLVRKTPEVPMPIFFALLGRPLTVKIAFQLSLQRVANVQRLFC